MNKINKEIKGKTILLIGEEKPRNMSLQDALDLARRERKDLIQIAENDVPVCRIMEYSKFVYEQKKRAKEAAKKQKQNIQEVKEIRITSNIGDNDLNIKANQTSKFIAKNKKVRLSLKLRGRESESIARDTIQRFLDAITEDCEVSDIKVEGRTLNCNIKKKGK